MIADSVAIVSSTYMMYVSTTIKRINDILLSQLVGGSHLTEINVHDH